MTIFSSTSGSLPNGGNAPGLTPVSNPIITNLSLLLQGTEYSFSVPTGTKRISARSRENRELWIAYTSGGTTGARLTIPLGASYSEVDLDVTTLTLYVQCPGASGTVVEITTWS